MASCTLSAEGTGPLAELAPVVADADLPANACMAGEQLFCTCPQAGLSGAKTCNADGLGFGECLGCPVGDASGLDARVEGSQPPSRGDAGASEGGTPIDAGISRDAGPPMDAEARSCVNGAVSCTVAAPCCTKKASVYYGACVIHCP